MIGRGALQGTEAIPDSSLWVLWQRTTMQVPSPPSNLNLSDQPSGPLSGPSDTIWRRRRLMGIGGNQSLVETSSNADERTPLSRFNSLPHDESYGSIPSPENASPTRSVFRSLRRFPSIGVRIPGMETSSPQTSPPASMYRKSYFDFGSQRPISAYDAPMLRPEGASPDAGPGARTNGIRVWYSSYSSVDWLHDMIKDSVRRFRLRKRTSFRGRLRNRIDRSVGWIIVTLVGFLSAVMAFVIVRSEQWLFDIKNGYCATGWWKAERFCCPGFDDVLPTTPSFVSRSQSESCEHWSTWADVFAGEGASELREDLLGYLVYAGIAVSTHFILALRNPPFLTPLSLPQLAWATISCLLTIHLTASNSFVTRKDSGVLGPSFAEADEIKERNDVQSPQKREVMYYVGEAPSTILYHS